jgi:Flp pilus assembly protein TadD
MEGDDKPSADYLAGVLQQTGREHEVPAIWKPIVEANPQNAQAQAKYAISLIQAGKTDEGEKAFDDALEVVEDNAIVERYYAPYLAQKGDLDRSMDFYEDCLDLAPTDVQLLIEYANTLKQAGRDFEIPKVLRDVLQANPDPNTRAQTLAWLIELEQPKRVESVQLAEKKMNDGDFVGAVRDLKPLRNWLADYWKLWALLSAAYNRLDQPEEAENAAKKLLELFPGCEPAYGELVQALSAQDRSEEAYQMMRYAAMNMPGALGVHINLAIAAKSAGHVEEARSLARQIREAVGPNEELAPLLNDLES